MPRTGRPKTTPKAVNIVAALRREKGWSQVQTAKALGISRTRISEYESGKSAIPLTIQRLTAIYRSLNDAEIANMEARMQYFMGHGITAQITYEGTRSED